METTNPNTDFWEGKRVLVTGHTGFKGSWLALWLNTLGATVGGLSLAPLGSPNLFSLAAIEDDLAHVVGDICDPSATASMISDFKPEVIFHLAAQALVRPSYNDPLCTFSTNIMGTAHVLDAIRNSNSVKTCVVATTDKVYLNQEDDQAFSERSPLGGHDPYSASKAGAEMVTQGYQKSFFESRGIGIAVARAGNAIGGGDWSEERLIPDAVRAWTSGNQLVVRRPDAVRPWQHVLDPLLGYIKLAESAWKSPNLSAPYNFGPDSTDVHNVRSVVEQAKTSFGKGIIRFEKHENGLHEASSLLLSNAKAKKDLRVFPRWTAANAINNTMNWYRHFYEGANARALCQADIRKFELSA